MRSKALPRDTKFMIHVQPNTCTAKYMYSQIHVQPNESGKMGPGPIFPWPSVTDGRGGEEGPFGHLPREGRRKWEDGPWAHLPMAFLHGWEREGGPFGHLLREGR